MTEPCTQALRLTILRAPCSKVSRTQLTLPLRFGGCGLTRASDIAALASFTGKMGHSRRWQPACPFPSNVLCRFKRATAAHVAEDCSSLHSRVGKKTCFFCIICFFSSTKKNMFFSNPTLLHSFFLLPPLWLAENRLPAKVEPQWLKLDCWSEKMQQFRWEKPRSQCSGRDMV